MNNNVTYSDSFGVEHIPKEIKKRIRNENIKTDIFRIQAYDSRIYRYFCIGLIDFTVKGKSLTEFTKLFSPKNFKKKIWWYNFIILNYFKNRY